MGTHPIFESDFDCLTEWAILGRVSTRAPSGRENWGHGHAGTTLVCAATVAIGKNQIAQRAAKKGEKIDVAEMNEGSKLAMRALKRATFYNIGFGSAIAGFCWWNQITCLQDLRRTVQSIKGVQISQEGSKPTKWEDIFPEESSKSEK